MKIAITDACIFIDLHDLDLTTAFFSLNFEIHTSLDVFNELYLAQQQPLSEFIHQKKFTIHNIQQKDRSIIIATNYPRSLSEMDKTVLYLAQKHQAMVLSSDKVVRTYAKNQSIDYHGMLWIFDQFIERKILTPQQAAIKLKALISLNPIYQNNSKLTSEFKKRLTAWGVR